MTAYRVGSGLRFEAGQVCFVQTLGILELLKQNDGHVSRRPPLLQPCKELTLPLDLSPALPDVALDHL